MFLTATPVLRDGQCIPASSQSFSSIKWIVYLDKNSQKIVSLLQRQKGESSSAIPPAGTWELCLHCLTATPVPAYRTWLGVLAAWIPQASCCFTSGILHHLGQISQQLRAPSICKSRGEALPAAFCNGIISACYCSSALN